MIKKIFSYGMLLVMMFSIMGCNKGSKLEVYKDTAKRTIEIYVENKEQDSYSIENWTVIEAFVMDSNIAVDTAKNNIQVDSAVTTVKEAIDMVEKKENEMKYKDIEPGFYSLLQAYTLGALKINDLKSIAYYHHNGIHCNENMMGLSFVPMPKNPTFLDADIEDKLKAEWNNVLYERGDFPPEMDIQIDKYYGTYNDCVVIMMDYVNETYIPTVHYDTIASIKYSYGTPRTIIVWKKH